MKHAQKHTPDPALYSLSALADLVAKEAAEAHGPAPADWGAEDDMTPLAWWEGLLFWGTVLAVGGALLWGMLRWLMAFGWGAGL